jgi:hypothetical protein
MVFMPGTRGEDLWRVPAVADTADKHMIAGLRSLTDRAAELMEEIIALPALPAHGDASPQNLLVERTAGGPGGSTSFAVIDWGLYGLACAGFDLGQLLAGWVNQGLMGGEELYRLEPLCLQACREGLAEARRESRKTLSAGVTRRPWPCSPDFRLSPRSAWHSQTRGDGPLRARPARLHGLTFRGAPALQQVNTVGGRTISAAVRARPVNRRHWSPSQLTQGKAEHGRRLRSETSVVEPGGGLLPGRASAVPGAHRPWLPVGRARSLFTSRSGGSVWCLVLYDGRIIDYKRDKGHVIVFQGFLDPG